MNLAVGTVEPLVTAELALEHGLTKEEYEKMLLFLGRTPTHTELGIYSVMWSEHCSYKNSISMLKTLPRSGKRLLVSAGEENAGLVDIGDGLAVAFKIESHNHPSAVEPYQGAATGVGGILRDIFTMGARPIAALNSLRFGNLQDDRVRYLFKNVVKGIGDYGNCFGVPTVGGEVYFDNCYANNPLVNAMAVGIVEHHLVARAVAKGIGNLVMIVGSSTGRDGIHGATFASEEISEESDTRRPSVQVGDPFTEKLLLEATLEAIREGLIVGIQDMGAAGLTCSSTEMSAKGKHGMKLNLDLVPLRENEMTSYEIMLSESQERMLLVVRPENHPKILNIFEKWDLSAITIGEVVAGDTVTVHHRGRREADVSAKSLVLGEGAPVYEREAREPEYLRIVRDFDPRTLAEPESYSEALIRLLASPNIASKHWIYRQYDSMVRTNTVAHVGDAAVVRLKGTRKSLSLKTDCNARYVYLNPRRGAQIAVAEAARNVVCTGAKPLAITNCLNFGNPYNPEVYWQFKEAVMGMGDACRILGTPVTGGNVSFYNESPETSVFPTPVIGMLGLIESDERITSSYFREPGDEIILLGRNDGEVGGSEYICQITGKALGDAPSIDLVYEKRLQDLCLELIGRTLVRSAHDCSEGGLAVALAEACFLGPDAVGARVYLNGRDRHRSDFLLFGEDQSRIVVSTKPGSGDEVLRLSAKHEIDAQRLGVVQKDPILEIEGLISLDTIQAGQAYRLSIPRAMGELE
ncbi:MAG TPA: phosphoribosylformylglycinamidine synthase subunit PurL [Bacteroidetes bacterium]|nr:phosphoribosylformylglycinamidine synthase subunit PurL [Bacteroidota bacterium]